MNLKTSPKEAIIILNYLSKKGSGILSFIQTHHSLLKFKERREKERMDESPEVIKVTISGVPTEETPFRKNLKTYSDMHKKWEKEAQEGLNLIYRDFIPLFKFARIESDYSIFNRRQTPEFKKFLQVTSKLERQLSDLEEKYQDIISLMRSPLFYIEDSCRVAYYDRSIELKPGTDEASFCECLFSVPIGQTQKYEDIYAFLKGEDPEESHKWPQKWRRVVINAYEGINKKTQEHFGFPIFKAKNQSLIYIKILPE